MYARVWMSEEQSQLQVVVGLHRQCLLMMNRVREREEAIKQAKTAQDRQAAKEDKAFYRLSLVFHGDEAEMVKSVLGKEPAQRIMELCRGL